MRIEQLVRALPGLEIVNTPKLSQGNCIEGRAFRELIQASFQSRPPRANEDRGRSWCRSVLGTAESSIGARAPVQRTCCVRNGFALPARR